MPFLGDARQPSWPSESSGIPPYFHQRPWLLVLRTTLYRCYLTYLLSYLLAFLSSLSHSFLYPSLPSLRIRPTLYLTAFPVSSGSFPIFFLRLFQWSVYCLYNPILVFALWRTGIKVSVPSLFIFPRACSISFRPPTLTHNTLWGSRHAS